MKEARAQAAEPNLVLDKSSSRQQAQLPTATSCRRETKLQDRALINMTESTTSAQQIPVHLTLPAAKFIIPAADEHTEEVVHCNRLANVLLLEYGPPLGASTRIAYERAIHELFTRARRDAYNEVVIKRSGQ